MESKNWYLPTGLGFLVLGIIIGAYFLTQNKEVPKQQTQQPSPQVQTSNMKLTSSAFENGFHLIHHFNTSIKLLCHQSLSSYRTAK